MSSSSTRKTFPAGLFLLEHLNLDVLSKPAVKDFYYALGCVHDKSRSTAQSMHANAGNLCQFHLGEAKGKLVGPTARCKCVLLRSCALGPLVSQAWRGTIELVYTQDALEQVWRATMFGNPNTRARACARTCIRIIVT